MCESKPASSWKTLPWTRCNSHQGMHKHIPLPKRYFTNVKEPFCLLSDAPSRLSLSYSQFTYLGTLSKNYVFFDLTDSPPLLEQYTVMGYEDIELNAMTWKNSVKKSVYPNLRNCFLSPTKFDCSKGYSARIILYPHYPGIILNLFLFGLYSQCLGYSVIKFVFSLAFNFVIVCHLSHGRVISFAGTSHSN